MNTSLIGPLGNVENLYLYIIVFWSLIWKGIALWRTAKNNQKYWYIAILILNTAGILPIVYLAFFRPKKKKKK